jgi:hypothetical protein
VDDPGQFKGSIHISPEHDSYDVLFQGIDATSYNWTGSELTLYNGNHSVGKFAITDEVGDGGFGAYQTARGVIISDGQPSGGTAIPMHSS